MAVTGFSIMTVDPLIPSSLWLALAVAGAALLIWYAIRRPAVQGIGRWPAVIGLMTAGLLVVLLILLNPIRVRPIPPPVGKPLLMVLVDSSASMAIHDAADDRTRYRAASETALAIAGSLKDTFDVRVRTFSGTSMAREAGDLLDRNPDGQVTDLGAAIAKNIDPDRPQGQAIVLLSDGGHNAGEFDAVADAVSRAKALDAAIYTRTFGGEGGGLNLAVNLRSTQELAFIDQQVPVDVTVTQHGARGARVDVRLLYEGKEVARRQVDLPAESNDVQFWVSQSKPGAYPYEVRVDPLPGELTQADNAATYLLRVIDQPVHVLMLEGKPYWDAKFLVRTLASVPAVELDSIVRITDGRLMRRTVSRSAKSRSPPTSAPAAGGPIQDERSEQWRIVSDPADLLASAERLRQYQIIVLGRDSEPFLTDAGIANLQNWIAHDGGSLVCYRGSPVAQVNQALSRLLPVRWQPAREARFRPRLTDLGRNLHWFAGAPGSDDGSSLLGLPTLAASEEVDRTKPAATVLATAELPGGGQTPVVVYQQYGTGRAVVIEGAGMWRWVFLPPQFQQRDAVYSELWHSLLRWLTFSDRLLPGQVAVLRSDKVVFDTIEPATAMLILRQQEGAATAPKLELQKDGSSKVVNVVATEMADVPGTFKVNFGKLAEGRYQAWLASGAGPGDVAARTVFDVRTSSQEEREPQARPDRMAWIATQSGGAVLGSDAPSEIARQFQQHMAVSRPPRYERATTWDRPWVLLVLFGLWAASWAIRRSAGLV